MNGELHLGARSTPGQMIVPFTTGHGTSLLETTFLFFHPSAVQCSWSHGTVSALKPRSSQPRASATRRSSAISPCTRKCTVHTGPRVSNIEDDALRESRRLGGIGNV